MTATMTQYVVDCASRSVQCQQDRLLGGLSAARVQLFHAVTGRCGRPLVVAGRVDVVRHRCRVLLDATARPHRRLRGGCLQVSAAR